MNRKKFIQPALSLMATAALFLPQLAEACSITCFKFEWLPPSITITHCTAEGEGATCECDDADEAKCVDGAAG